MDIAVRRANSVDTNYGMALKYHTYSTWWSKKVIHCQESSLSRTKNRQCGNISIHFEYKMSTRML